MSFSSFAVISSAASRLFDREAAVVMCALQRTTLMDFENLHQFKFNLFL